MLMRVAHGFRHAVGAVWRELTGLVDSPGLNRQGGTARSDHGQLSDEGWLQGSAPPDRRQDDHSAERGGRIPD